MAQQPTIGAPLNRLSIEELQEIWADPGFDMADIAKMTPGERSDFQQIMMQAPKRGVLPLGGQVSPESIFEPPGATHEDIGRFLGGAGLNAASLGLGMASGGMSLPLRASLQTLLGAGSSLAQGEDPAEGATLQGGIEALLGGAGKLIPRVMNRAALFTGLGGGPLRKEQGEILDALGRQQKRRGMTPPPAIGNTPTWEKFKKQSTAKLEELENQFPNREYDFRGMSAGKSTQGLDIPSEALGTTDPMKVMEDIRGQNRSFYRGNRSILAGRQQSPPAGAQPLKVTPQKPTPPRGKGQPPPPTGLSTTRQSPVPSTRTSPAAEPPGQKLLEGPVMEGEIVYPDMGGELIEGTGPSLGKRGKQPPVFANVRELGEMKRKQGKAASRIFEKNDKGEWVVISESPGQTASKARQRNLKTAQEGELLRQGGPDALADVQGANADISDLYKILEAEKQLRAGLMFAATRAGIGAGLGSAIGRASDNTGSGAGIGGVAGLLATPRNLSRAGLFGGTLANAGRHVIRAGHLRDELEEGPKVRRRKP